MVAIWIIWHKKFLKIGEIGEKDNKLKGTTGNNWIVIDSCTQKQSKEKLPEQLIDKTDIFKNKFSNNLDRRFVGILDFL